MTTPVTSCAVGVAARRPPRRAARRRGPRARPSCPPRAKRSPERPADAARAAGDDRDPAVEVLHPGRPTPGSRASSGARRRPGSAAPRRGCRRRASGSATSAGVGPNSRGEGREGVEVEAVERGRRCRRPWPGPRPRAPRRTRAGGGRREYGQHPSRWGKSLPHMMRSTPTRSRISTSGRRMKLEPTWHWRAQYSDGLSDSSPSRRAELRLLRSGRAADPGEAAVVVVEPGELLGHPRRALLGEHELQVRVAFHHPGEDQVPERAVRPPGDLEQEHRPAPPGTRPCRAPRCRCGG